MNKSKVSIMAVVALAVAIQASFGAVVSIGQAKKTGPGWTGYTRGIVTAVFREWNTFCISADNRSAALTAAPLPASLPKIGDELTVAGTIQADGTLAITGSSPTGRTGVSVPSVGMSNYSITGAVGNPGLNNLDLVATTWGSVTSLQTVSSDLSTRFFISDGSKDGGGTGSNYTADMVANWTPAVAPPVGVGSDHSWSYGLDSNTSDAVLSPFSFTGYPAWLSTGPQYYYVTLDSPMALQFSNMAPVGDYFLIHTSPNANQAEIIRWTAPRDMSVTFHGIAFKPSWEPDLTRVQQFGIRLNSGSAIVSGEVSQFTQENTPVSFSISNPVSVMQGDVLDLYVYRRSDTTQGFIGLQWTIEEAGASFDPSYVQVIASPGVDMSGPMAIGDFITVKGITGKGTYNSTPIRTITMFPPIVEQRKYPVVVVSWDGTGDYGYETPGTQTCGLQEAIDYCVANHRDLYIKGGWGGQTTGYALSQTVYIPAAENFRIDSGIYTMGYYGPDDQDGFVIDSAYNCHYYFGLVGNMHSGAIFRVKPTTPLPSYGSAMFTYSSFQTSSVGQGGTPGVAFQGIGGIVFDTSQGPIVHNNFFFSAPMSSRRVITCGGSGYEFANNHLRASHLHTEKYIDNPILLTVGPTCHQNVFEVAISINGTPNTATGIDIYGSDNIIDAIIPWGAEYRPATGVVFEGSSEGNVVSLRQPNSTANPLALISDLATNPTNRVLWTGSTAPISTVTATTGTFTYRQRLYPATVKIVGGTVTDVRLIHGGSTVDYGSSPKDVFMSVGDQLQVDSTSAPQLKVIPFKER